MLLPLLLLLLFVVAIAVVVFVAVLVTSIQVVPQFERMVSGLSSFHT